MLFALLKHLSILPSCFSYTFKTRLPYRRVQAELNVLKHKQFSPQEQPQINMCTVALSLQNSLRQTPDYGYQQFARERLLKPFIAIRATKGCPLYTQSLQPGLSKHSVSLGPQHRYFFSNYCSDE